ncbi:30S ribosomal protein S13 [Dissostichus eleginoides]|uniref:30S ribosomal protein S13 n=1 Tax=Dissostichus eleginoides TaxID=100907 RepID=A0AAD9B922_DISEL|nr:30S ribosomal protein S13 [Dissostichus eleginoides]
MSIVYSLSVDDEADKRLLEETASLEELKTELHCVSDDMVSTWISDVKEWASGTSETSGTSEDILQTALQQSIEGLYLSVRQRKQSLYRQNDSSKLRHRLRRKLADDKKRLNQEILKYNQLVHDSARGIDVAAVEHSLSGGSIMSALWPWEVHGMANFTAKKKILDQVMLTRRLQEEKGILLLEMAQHCTWLQNMAVALKNKVAEEDVDKGNGGLGLRRKHSEASERLQVVMQQYKTALGPDASFLQHEEESQSGLSSPDNK